MDPQPENPVEEIWRLQRCINDLVSVLALPAIWSGRDSSQIVRTLPDALLGMLNLDFVYVRLKDPVSPSFVETARVAPSRNLTDQPHEIGAMLDTLLGPDAKKWASLAQLRLDDEDLVVAPMQMGSEGDAGVLVAGSRRADFPGQTDRLLLSVAANQVAIAQQGARLLHEQRRITTELDQRVALRTAQLSAANEELKKEVAERTRAETALRASEQNLKLTVDTIPALVWSARPDGTAEFFNQHYLDYLGLSAEHAQDWGWTRAIHPDDLDRLAGAWQAIAASGQPGEAEGRLRRFDGEYRWFLLRANPLRDEDGNIVNWHGINTDIEDRKRAEEKTRLIIHTALDAVIAMDAQGTITTWNRQAESTFGWSNEEAVGRNLSDMIIPQRFREAHKHGLRHFLASGEGPILGRRIEVTALRRNGAEFPAELEVMPLRLGRNWIFSAFLRDIGDSKLAEQKLRESELNLRRMIETIPSMIWSATPDGTLDYFNARFRDYAGLAADDIMGEGWTKHIHPDDAEATAQAWAQCVKTGEPYLVELRSFHAASGTYRWCVASALPLLDDDGRILKWYGTIVDLHDWRRAQEELRGTQSALARVSRVMAMGQLTASIAHEISQPLSGIITNASTCLRMLNGDPPNVDGARETAKRTIRDGNRASEVITRLRALFEKKDAATEPVDLNESTREVIALTSNDLHRNRVVLRTELAEDIPSIPGDRVQLQQVILNLLLNASDAMNGIDDRPRQLLVRTERDGEDHVRVTVQDAGVGIDPRDMGRLFDPFYTTKSGGMGIGLSVSRSIIESHRGRLWAVPNDGPGTSFLFSVPQKADGRAGNPDLAINRASAVADGEHPTPNR